MSFINTGFAGLKIYTPPQFDDSRGVFFKTFHEGLFIENGIAFTLREEFFSISHKNVLRGMHFQVPPCAHAKIITCLSGRVLDVVLDLRKAEPTYGKSFSVELSGGSRKVVFIPEGFAHGFLSLEDNSLLHYKTNAVYCPQNDQGIHWDKFGFKWPIVNPVVSARDSGFEGLESFPNPF